MKKKLLASVIMASFAWNTGAIAMGVEDRLTQMEQRLAEQDETIRKQDKQIAELIANASKSSNGGWWQNIEIGGLVKLRVSHTDNEDMTSAVNNNSNNDANLSTVELGVATQVNDWVSVDVALLWGDEDGGDHNLTVDRATFTIGNADETPFYFTGGRMAVPFGSFTTHMVSDPYTFNLGETKETALLLGYNADGVAASVYAFNGDVDHGDQFIDNIGAKLSYSVETDNSVLVFGVSYINDIGDAGGITGGASLSTTANSVPGAGVNASYSHGALSFIGEYITATDNFLNSEVAFNGQGAKPSAWNIEVGYNLNGIADGAMVAIGYQQTDEAVALGLPESRLSAVLSVNLMQNIAWSFQFAHDKAYSTADGGTGQDANTAIAQLAVEF